ncbi:MAG: sugar transferase [Flavitalea sp.]
MQPFLQEETIQTKKYRHFTVPVVSSPTDNKKPEFFYIGKKTGMIDSLINTFESGYAAENADHARTMLKRLALNASSIPDIIIAEASVGYNDLLLFHQFIATQKPLASIPLIIEGSDITTEELEKFRNQPFADDIISLKDLPTAKLMSKIRFWKKVKSRISAIHHDQANADLSPVKSSPADFSKRIFDVVISALMMMILSPIFLLIIIALKIESKGPVFYISKRAGKGYRIFSFYKFRTMDPKANDNIDSVSHMNLYSPLTAEGPMFIKIHNDPRITRLGAFLRKCSLDELPQLLNVFKGNMSLVGNRPLPLYEAATLTTDQWAKRFMAPAGMTGLWQIKKKNKYRMTAEERLDLDINYADKSNFLFDLWIMANTPTAVIQRTNA